MIGERLKINSISYFDKVDNNEDYQLSYIAVSLDDLETKNHFYIRITEQAVLDLVKKEIHRLSEEMIK